MSGRGKKARERQALTSWRVQRGRVSTQEEREREREGEGTHRLGSTVQDSSGHGRSEQARGTHLLESAEGQVRIQKENEGVRGTDRLESIEGGDLLEHGKKASSDGHSLPGEHRRKKSGRRKKASNGHLALTLWRPQRRTSHDTERKKESERVRLTLWRA
jgi:hypothetical protein